MITATMVYSRASMAKVPVLILSLFLFVVIDQRAFAGNTGSADSAAKQAAQILFAHSPLPREPRVNGIRYGFWFALRDLESAMTSWLNPNSENYFYRFVEHLAPAPLVGLRDHAALYESLRSDYIRLVNSGKIDSYTYESLPEDLKFKLALSQAIYGHYLMTGLDHSKVLTSFHRQMWDSRYITTFMFSTFVDSGHRPLESLGSLGRNSLRAQNVITRVMSIFDAAIIASINDFHSLTQTALSAGEDFDFREAYSLLKKHDSGLGKSELQYRLGYLVDKLYRAAQYANDTVRDRKRVNNLASLEAEMASLGKGLRSSVDAVRFYALARAKGSFRHFEGHVGARLADPEDDLDAIFGVNAHVGGVTLPKGFSSKKAYQMYIDSIVIEYILAAGSIMAKIAEVPEGRGSAINRISQELRFRSAQAGIFLNPSPASVATSAQTGLVLRAEDRPIATTSSIQRRDFASPALAQERASIEERLWAVFYENLGADMMDTEAGSCARYLLGQG